MKIILLKDVPKIGRKHDVKNVADGYALNQLIPKGLAQVANDALVKKVEKMKADEAIAKKKIEEKVAEQFAKVKGAVIHIEEKANEKGHLFSSVHKETVLKKLSQIVGVEIDQAQLVMDKQIKEVGEHSLEVKYGNQSVKFTLVVQAVK